MLGREPESRGEIGLHPWKGLPTAFLHAQAMPSTGQAHHDVSGGHAANGRRRAVLLETNGHHAAAPLEIVRDVHGEHAPALVDSLLAPVILQRDGLMVQIEDARNYNNLRKLVHGARGALEPRHFRAAMLRLVALVEEEPPSSPFDRQHMQMMLELVTDGLLPWADDLTPSQLVSAAALTAKLGYFNGPLLQRLREAAKSNVAKFDPGHVAGMLWALAR